MQLDASETKRTVLEKVTTCLRSLAIGGDEGRALFLSGLAPRGLAIHARKESFPRPDAADLQYEDFRDDFAARIPWHSGVKIDESVDGQATVLVDHDVAMVWFPYFFTNDGVLSHVGTNVFTLVLRDWKGQGVVDWRIVSMTDTARAPSDEDRKRHEATS